MKRITLVGYALFFFGTAAYAGGAAVMDKVSPSETQVHFTQSLTDNNQ